MFFGVAISHIKNIAGIGEKFSSFKQYNLQEVGFYKIVYLLINCAILGFIAYKFNNMGLLPLSPSDYMEYLPENPDIDKVDLVIN